MKLFIRLKSNPRYAINSDGQLKDMQEPTKWIGSVNEADGTVISNRYGSRRTTRTMVEKIVKPKNGKHYLLIEGNNVPQEIAVETLIAEIKAISEQKGISLESK